MPIPARLVTLAAMTAPQRIVMVRHGETVGQSSVRYYGSTDVALSDEGRTQMHEARWRLRNEVFDLAVASPLQRAVEAARIVVGGKSFQLDRDLREVDFGRWEGLTLEEIQAVDPVLYEDWQSSVRDFNYPEGERRTDFRERIERGLDRIMDADAANVLVAAHKGVVRVIAEKILGEALPDKEPPLGGIVSLSRSADGHWHPGRRGSNPAAVGATPRPRP